MSRLSAYLLAASAMLLAAPANAQDDSRAKRLIDSKYQISVGQFFPERSFSLRVDGGIPDLNEDIRIDEELRLRTRDKILSAEASMRIGERWRLAGQFFEATNDGELVLQNDIEWEDVVYQAGTNVSGGTRFSVLRLFVSRDFNTADHHSFGIGLGIHELKIEAFLAGEAIVAGGGSEFRSESAKTDGPMPNIGIWYSRVLTDSLALNTRLDWLEASISPYNGGILNAAVALHYGVTDNIGLGFAYNYFEFDAGIKDSGWRGDAEVRYHGPYISLKAYW